MKKVIVFGATLSAKRLINEIKESNTIIAFCDNDSNKWGKTIDGILIVSPDKIIDMNYDSIIIISLSALYAIKAQLMEMGIPEYKIDTSKIEFNVKARERFCTDFSRIIKERKIQGAVAEAGVFQGEYAKIINKCFDDRKLYLFDTFEGFDERDVIIEKEEKLSEATKGNLNNTSIELVMSKMSYKDNVIIKKGYFPDTAQGINENFCFVNLDLDLYNPTIEGLKFFWPKMVKGGIILVHDYLSIGYEGVNKAVLEFEAMENVVPFPISDGWSVAFQKN